MMSAPINKEKTEKEKTITQNHSFEIINFSAFEGFFIELQKKIEQRFEITKEKLFKKKTFYEVEIIEGVFSTHSIGKHLKEYLQFIIEKTRKKEGVLQELKDKIISFIDKLEQKSLVFKSELEEKTKQWGYSIILENKINIWWTKEFQEKWEELLFFSDSEEEVIIFLNKEFEKIKKTKEGKGPYCFCSFYFWCVMQNYILETALKKNKGRDAKRREIGIPFILDNYYFFLDGDHDKQRNFVEYNFDSFFNKLSNYLKETSEKWWKDKLEKTREKHTQHRR